MCKEDYEGGESVRQLPCNHLFHDGCIVPWLEQVSWQKTLAGAQGSGLCCFFLLAFAPRQDRTGQVDPGATFSLSHRSYPVLT